tara:strand:+ start:40 stop:1413 length:1374 start_codon:yes stop_codon:yes gene_type:complete
MSETRDKLEELALNSENKQVREIATQKLADQFQGDEIAQKMIKLSQLLGGGKGGMDIDEEALKNLIKEEIESTKFGIDNLDALVKAKIDGKSLKANVTITRPSGKVVKRTINLSKVNTPLFQKIMSDVLARNNVYLYGGAGTGKTFSATTIKKLLDWDLIIVNCNQFTSPLELIGGQTIDGYQEGKVTRAWGNLDEFGEKTGRGVVLLLDELPKIDPNTAGILNNALAKVSEFEFDVNGVEQPMYLQNAQGKDIERGEIFIMATGNSLLNSADADYEANFKQDLSLQDRFVGSTYKVVVDVKYEWTDILNKQWCFIFIYLNKLRELIFEKGFQGKAFVSIRIMLSVAKTYQVYRSLISKSQNITPNPDLQNVPATGIGYGSIVGAFEGSKKVGAFEPKTIKDSMEEFFSLFTEEQREQLKDESEYSAFLEIVKDKDRLPMDKLNTESELKQVEKIIS